jgi:hypothetical protein
METVTILLHPFWSPDGYTDSIVSEMVQTLNDSDHKYILTPELSKTYKKAMLRYNWSTITNVSKNLSALEVENSIYVGALSHLYNQIGFRPKAVGLNTTSRFKRAGMYCHKEYRHNVIKLIMRFDNKKLFPIFEGDLLFAKYYVESIKHLISRVDPTNRWILSAGDLVLALRFTERIVSLHPNAKFKLFGEFRNQCVFSLESLMKKLGADVTVVEHLCSYNQNKDTNSVQYTDDANYFYVNNKR